MKQQTKITRLNVAEVALGNALEWTIQRWVITTGWNVRAEDTPWLDGQVGEERIGTEFYEDYARDVGLGIVRDDPHAGLLEDFAALSGGEFDASVVRPEIRGFYERTARYGLDVWAGWKGPLRYPPRTLIYLISRDIQQLNLPTSSLAASAGMSSELIRLADPFTGEAAYAGWLRRSVAGEVIYAGLYTTCELPDREGRFVKVVFPLPGGSATVSLRPENRPDGSFALVSAGHGFGDAGYYRVHRTDSGEMWVRHLPLKKIIHVFVDSASTLRADHVFRFAGLRFLDLHYKITPRI